MGIVFRGRDTQLQRDVALKLLPDHFASDPDRLLRFQREAQVLASLNHPNIAQIYGLEQSAAPGAIVMEFVEGETLAERIKRGPISAEDAIQIAKQMAAALDAAHERGIVHRDLKPANIKLTPDGKVKVLDFGLAKAFGNPAGDADFSNSPTILSGSVPGVVMGTAAYMSPEQARGKQVDARTDIWAFGCVLFEMLARRPAFDGETATDIIAKIVAGQPNWELLPPDTPAPIRKLLTAALKKEPRLRLRNIGDIDLILDSAQAVPESKSPSTESGRRRISWLTAALTLALASALVPTILYFRRASTDAPEMRFEMPVPGYVSGYNTNLAISPDGQRVAYVALSEGKQAIWIRPIGSLTAHILNGTDNGSGLFWSPDSRYLAFVADEKLKKVDVASGTTQELCAAPSNNGSGTWNADGVILFASGQGIARVSASGGPVTQITKADAKELAHVAPQFLPDGHHFLYHAIANTPDQKTTVYVGSLVATTPIRVTELLLNGSASNSGLVYATPGYVVFSRGRTLMAQPFDPSNGALSGEPTPLAENVLSDFSISLNGVLVYRNWTQPAQQPGAQLLRFDRSGKPAGQIAVPGIVGSFRLSPDGQQIAMDTNVRIGGTTSDVWVINARGVPTKLTVEPGRFAGFPVWSPDKGHIIFAGVRSDSPFPRLYQKSSNGIGTEELLLSGDADAVDLPQDSWGRYIVFERVKPRQVNTADLWILDSDKKAAPFLHTAFAKMQPQISPDGRYIVYATNESGPFQIVVRTFPDPTRGQWQITAQGGTEPLWRGDGKELYYLAPDGKIMAVPIKLDPKFDPGPATALFATTLPPEPEPFLRRYAVTANGQSFLVASAPSTPPSNMNSIPITAVVNWTSALRKK